MAQIAKNLTKKHPKVIKGFDQPPPSSDDTKGNLSEPEHAPAAPTPDPDNDDLGMTQFNRRVFKKFKKDFLILENHLNNTRGPTEPKLSGAVILSEMLELYLAMLRRKKRI